MTMTDTTEGPHWKVLGQQPTNGPGVAGNFVPGHVITAQLDSGSVFTVFVPDDVYVYPDRVRAALHDKAVAVAAVDSLRN